MKPGSRYLLKVFVLLVLCALGYVLIENYARIQWPETIVYRYLAFAVVIYVLFFVMESVAWRLLLRYITTITLPFTVALQQIGFLMTGKYLPGKVWGILARNQQLLKYRISASQGMAAAFLEQFVSLHAGASLALCGLGFYRSIPEGMLALVVCILVLWLVMIGYLPILKWLLALLKRWLPASGMDLDGIASSPGHYAVLFVIALFQWLILGLILVFLVMAFVQAPVDAKLVLLVVSANAVAMMAGFVVLVAPGGVGVREAALSGILVLGLSLPDAILVSLLYRLFLTVADGSTGMALLLEYRLGRRNRLS